MWEFFGNFSKKSHFSIFTFSHSGNYADSENVIVGQFGAKFFLSWNFKISMAKISRNLNLFRMAAMMVFIMNSVAVLEI